MWGDGVDDLNNIVPEDFIEVHEFPTIPEPSTFILAALGLLGLLVRRRLRA